MASVQNEEMTSLLSRANLAQMNPESFHTLSLCSPYRTECGYCHGDRLHVLTQKNPYPGLPGEPEVEILHIASPISEKKEGTSAEDCDDRGSNEVMSEDMKSPEIITAKTTSDAYALQFKNISTKAYLKLIDKGWRRSGKLLYLPKNWNSCCAAIPIRLETPRFTISKSQKKVLRRLKNILGIDHREETKKANDKFSSSVCTRKVKRQKHQPNKRKDWAHGVEFKAKCILDEDGILDRLRNQTMNHITKKVPDLQMSNCSLAKICAFKPSKFTKPRKESTDIISIECTLSSRICPALHGQSKGKIDRILTAKSLSQTLENTKASLKSSNEKIQFQKINFHEKSAQMIVQLKVILHKNDVQAYQDDPMESSAGNASMSSNETKDFIKEFVKASLQLTPEEEKSLHPPYTLTVKSISADVSACMPQVHMLYCRYQKSIHGDEDPYSGARSSAALPSLDITKESKSNNTEDDESDNDDDNGNLITEENFAAYYPDYDKDQIKKIHKSYLSFCRFLCSSPIVQDETIPYNTCNGKTKVEGEDSDFPISIAEDDVRIPCGSYHQHYLINDKYLIAVGVVDILPHCLSSVYSFYDPYLSNILNLGKVTALYEIYWVKMALHYRPALKYYYLGFYIHSCQKMRYKAEYKPSELLCPCRGVWVGFEDAKVRIDARSPIRNVCNISATDDEFFAKAKISQEVNDPEFNKMNEEVVNKILFDIGAGRYLTMNMITEEAQEIVRPLLKELVEETGPEVALESIVKLCS